MAAVGVARRADRGANGRRVGGDGEPRIVDAASFEEVAAREHDVAGAYFFMMLDCLVDLAEFVANDFVRKPQLYTRVSDATARLISSFRVEIGKRVGLPSKDQRAEIFLAIFGQTAESPADTDSDFLRLARDLVSATSAYAERVFDTGESMLAERVRTANVPFTEFLSGMNGASVRSSRNNFLAPVATNAYTILRDAGIAAVFGVPRPSDEWPFVENADGSRLVEAIASQMANSTGTPLTRQRFSSLQRVGLRGAEALSAVVDVSDGATAAPLKRLITSAYTWGAALESLSAGTVTAPPNGRPALGSGVASLVRR